MTAEQPTELAGIDHRLGRLRAERGWTQADVAARTGLKRSQIAFFESGSRLPDITHLLRFARAFEVPIQRFFSDNDRPGTSWPDVAFELRRLGLIDLWIAEPKVPGAFRHPEEVVTLSVASDEPQARIVEGLPAVLAWNRWNPVLLRAFATVAGRPVARRLAWLADIATAIERTGGFPGGFAGRTDLARFLKRVSLPAQDAPLDGLGQLDTQLPKSPIWKRWRIAYPATLETFRKRADNLLTLRAAERHDLSVRGRRHT